MAVANSKPVTADQLAGMSVEGRLELVRGEVVEMAPTGFEHGAIVAKLTMLMNHHATTRGLGKVVTGDVGFHLAKEPDLVRAPDIAFLTSDSIPTGLASRRFVEGAPVLVVEVVSPTDRASDIVERIDDYLDAGARLIWVVYPSRQQVVEYNSPGESRILRPGDRLDGGDILPGFSCPVDDIFAD